MNNMQRAFKQKSKMDGLRVKSLADGGHVQGAGTGTSDSINARLSDGEYVLPADTVAQLGVENLDALKEATHTPARGLRGGYANGGIVNRVPNPLNPQAQFQPEKFMGNAEQVPPNNQGNGPSMGRPQGMQAVAQRMINGPKPVPALAAPAAPVPSAGTYGAGPSSLAGDGVSPAQRLGGVGGAAGPAAPAAPSTAARLAGGLRGALNSGIGRAVAVVSAGQAIQDSRDEDATARYAKRFGVDEPTGDGSVGDIAKFIGLRAGGFASDLGNRLTGGYAGRLYRDTPDEALPPGVMAAAPAGTGTAAGVPVAEDEVNPISLDTAAMTNNAERFGLPQQMQREAVATTGTALRGGNENLTTDFNQADANVRATARGLRQGQAAMLTGLDGGDRIYATKDAKGQLVLTGTGDGSASAAYEQTAQYKNAVAAAGRDRDLLAQYEERNKESDLRAAVAGASIGGLRGARQNLADYMQQKTLDKQLGAAAQNARGSRALDVAKFAAEQQNKDREFGLQTQKFANEQEREAFTQKQQATSGLSDRYAKQFVGPDGKPDTARVALFTNGVQNFLGNRQAELEQKAASGKATQQEQQALRAIQTKGVAALDENDLAHIESLIKTGERTKETSGLLGGKYVASSNPADNEIVGREQNLFGSDTLRQRGGGTVREADLRYDEPANRLLTDRFKNKTTDFDLARKGLRQ